MSPLNYPSLRDLAKTDKQLKKLESAKSKMEKRGTPASPELLKEIEKASSQTRENLPKWVTDPKWIDKLEDLQKGLINRINDLVGKNDSERHIEQLKAQLKKVEKVLHEPKIYLPGVMSRKEYAQQISETTEKISETTGTKHEEKEHIPDENETLNALESRFNTNLKLHEGIQWAEVKASLESNPEALKSLALMEAAGHEPDVYHAENDAYYFGTCSIESPKSGRNLGYEDADKQAKKMGITIMSQEHYQDILQKKGKFDNDSSSWVESEFLIQTLFQTKFCGLLGGENVMWSSTPYGYAFKNVGWRGSLRVKKS